MFKVCASDLYPLAPLRLVNTYLSIKDSTIIQFDKNPYCYHFSPLECCVNAPRRSSDRDGDIPS